jgi:hypothetical protein
VFEDSKVIGRIDMKKHSVYEHPAQFRLKMTLLAAILFSIAIASESRLLILASAVVFIGYIFYRVLTDPVKRPAEFKSSPIRNPEE